MNSFFYSLLNERSAFRLESLQQYIDILKWSNNNVYKVGPSTFVFRVKTYNKILRVICEICESPFHSTNAFKDYEADQLVPEHRN